MNLIHLDPQVLWQPYQTLSGGEQTKVLLSLLFTQENFFPLIDEPTNHLDLQGRQHVAEYLKQKDGFIIVSHDRQFLNQVTDHTLAIEKSQLVLYQENFATYEEQKALRDEFELAQNRKIKKEVSRLKKRRLKKRRLKKRNGLVHEKKINTENLQKKAVTVFLILELSAHALHVP